MKVFVTGSQGFVGHNLVEHLRKQGHEVCSLVHDLKKDWAIWNPAFFGDIRDFKRMREILFDYKPDGIVHLAGQAIVGKAHMDPYSTFDVNVNGTIALLQAWREACSTAHFVHFSTDKVYGNGLGKKERDALQVTGDPYQVSKAAADLIAQSYLPNITITRSCNIYGPGDQEPSRLIPSAIQSCLRGEQPVLRNPMASREYIYIGDVCKILSWILEKRKMRIWNIGSGQVLSAAQVAKRIIVEFVPILSYYTKYEKYAELAEQSLNTEKLCGEMDCLAFTTLQAGIRRTVEWWRENESEWAWKIIQSGQVTIPP